MAHPPQFLRPRTTPPPAAAAMVAFLISALCTTALARRFLLNSDEVQSYLAAQSILHGNLLLAGWHLSVDNFYFDDTLPLVLLEGVFGRHIGVLAVFAGCSQLALLAAAIAAAVLGMAAPRDQLMGLAVIVALLAVPPAGIYLPILVPGMHGSGLILSLAALTFLDRLSRHPGGVGQARLAAAFCLCAWAASASDPFTLVYAFGPAALVLGFACLTDAASRPPARLLALLAGTVAAGMATPRLIAALGGFHLEPTLSFSFVPPDQLWRSIEGVFFGLLNEAGANLFGRDLDSPATVSMGLRLAAWLAGLWAIRARWGRGAGLLDRFLAAGCGVLAAACLTSRMFVIDVPDTPAVGVSEAVRYLSPLLVFGAVLAARAMPAAIRTLKPPRLRWMACAMLAAIPLCLLAGRAALALRWLAEPAAMAASPQEMAGRFLLSRGLTCGVGAFWESSIITALMDNRVKVRAVKGPPSGPLKPNPWLADDAWYTGMARPMFAIWHEGFEDWYHITPQTLRATYGDPVRTDKVAGFTIATYAHPKCT